MKLLIDVKPGMKFNRLTAIADKGKDKSNHSIWLFRCDCGKEKIIGRYQVVIGKTQSCGCLNKEILKTGDLRRDHGMRYTKIYSIWKGIHARCNAKPYNKNYKWYKDVSYCKEWEKFKPFYEWAMANGYHEGLTIDRIDNNKGYSPDNCRWATVQQQNNNKSTNRFVGYKGETLSVTQWSRKYHFHPSCFYQMLRKGVSEQDILAYYENKYFLETEQD